MVNEQSAMQASAVCSCVRILAETIASLLLYTYRHTNNGKEKAVGHPLYYLHHSEPNPEMTSFVFRETLMGHLLLWGNAYAQIIRDGRGKVIALICYYPTRWRWTKTRTVSTIHYVAMRCCIYPISGLIDSLATHRLLWPRMRSAWLSLLRNTLPSSLLMAPTPVVC